MKSITFDTVLGRVDKSFWKRILGNTGELLRSYALEGPQKASVSAQRRIAWAALKYPGGIQDARTAVTELIEVDEIDPIIGYRGLLGMLMDALAWDDFDKEIENACKCVPTLFEEWQAFRMHALVQQRHYAQAASLGEKLLQSDIVADEFTHYVFVGLLLTTAYSRCERPQDALRAAELLEVLPLPPVVLHELLTRKLHPLLAVQGFDRAEDAIKILGQGSVHARWTSALVNLLLAKHRRQSDELFVAGTRLLRRHLKPHSLSYVAELKNINVKMGQMCVQISHKSATHEYTSFLGQFEQTMMSVCCEVAWACNTRDRVDLAAAVWRAMVESPATPPGMKQIARDELLLYCGLGLVPSSPWESFAIDTRRIHLLASELDLTRLESLGGEN